MKANQFRAMMLVLLMAIVSLGRANGQTLTVTGVVTDATDGTPIVGCCVLIEGTTNGVVTNMHGKYTISAKKGATLHTVAKDVKLQVEFNPSQVQAYRLVGYESRLLKDEDFNNGAKNTGNMGVGYTVTAFYEVILVGVKHLYVGKVNELKYQKAEKKKTTAKPTGANELLKVKLRYKAPDKEVNQKMVIETAKQGLKMINCS